MSLLGNRFFQLLSFRISTSLTFRGRSMESLLKPPELVRGMMVLERKLFEKTLEVPVLTLKHIKLSSVLPVLKKYLLKVENLKPIQHAHMEETLIYLNPVIIKQWKSIPEDVRQKLCSESVKEEYLKIIPYTLKYENFTAEDILRAVLPPDKEGLSSFTKVGHIVHVNLRDHLLPYKNVIAEILLDKVPGCRTVVNKANIIDNTYRNFAMDVLIGDPDMLTTVKENNCKFKFDFSKVYWNSRLCTEHERIVKKFQKGDVLFDVFAGVGPFAVPAGKKKCTVFANDLNPDSFTWLKYNFEVNKVDQADYKLYNKDGHDFIKDDIKMLLPKFLEDGRNVYITMNLPAMALEFLNSFVGLFRHELLPEYSNPPLVFVYCFAKGEDCMEITKNKIKETVACDLSDKIVDIFRVRTVSSLKEMMRVTLRLERDILIAERKRKLEDHCNEVENKKVNREDDLPRSQHLAPNEPLVHPPKDFSKLSGASLNLYMEGQRSPRMDSRIRLRQLGSHKVIVMGKNNKKSNNVFKVAGAKSLKLKAKAKAVKTAMKHTNIKNKHDVQEIDKALIHLEDKIRQTSQSAKKVEEFPKSKLPIKNAEDAQALKEKSETAIQDLNSMQL